MPKGGLRQPSFRGLRQDKDIRVRERSKKVNENQFPTFINFFLLLGALSQSQPQLKLTKKYPLNVIPSHHNHEQHQQGKTNKMYHTFFFAINRLATNCFN